MVGAGHERFETAPGEQAQVDYGQLQVLIAEQPAAVHLFVFTLGYSRRLFTHAYPNEKLATLWVAWPPSSGAERSISEVAGQGVAGLQLAAGQTIHDQNVFNEESRLDCW